MVQAGGKILSSEIYKLFEIRKNFHTSASSLLLYLYKKSGHKTDCNNYRGISLSPTTYKILYNILSRLTIHKDEIIEDHQCALRITGELLLRDQILEKMKVSLGSTSVT
jgi:hypothetical protein